ncbi:MAG: hypothetical protein ACR2P7_02785, partial [bacterium]
HSALRDDRARLSLNVRRDGAITAARLATADGWWLSHGYNDGRMLGARDHSFDNASFGDDSLGGAFGNRSFGDNSFGNASSGAAEALAAPYLSLVRDGAGVGWSRGGGAGFALMHGAPQFDDESKPGGAHGLGVLFSMPMEFAFGRDAGNRNAESRNTMDRDVAGRNASRIANRNTGTRNAGLWLQAGAVREGDGFLGARPQGLLGRARGATWFAGVNGAWTLGARGRKAWRMSAAAYLGRTRAQLGDGFLRDADDLLSSAFSLGAGRAGLWRRGDWLGLRLSQPLRVERGGVTLRAPSGRTKYGAVVHEEHDISLAPDGRAVRAGATYRMRIKGGALEGNLGIERQPQHDRAQHAQAFAGIKFERRF